MREPPISTGQHRIDDLYCHYLVVYQVYSHWMDFEVYENVSYYPDSEYFRSAKDGSDLSVTDIKDAEIELSGGRSLQVPVVPLVSKESMNIMDGSFTLRLRTP